MKTNKMRNDTLVAVVGLGLIGCPSGEETKPTATTGQFRTPAEPPGQAETPAAPATPTKLLYRSRQVSTRFASPERAAALKAAAPPQTAHDCSAIIWRFIEGNDTAPVAMTGEEIAAELHDTFATTVLCDGTPSSSLALLIDAIDGANPALVKMQYVVAEGGQIPPTPTIPASAASRDMRYAITWADAGGSIQVLGSSAPPSDDSQVFLQVIAFDPEKQLFNFYERLAPGSNEFFWAGDSTWARKTATMGQGCFDCHHNGVPIMKELKIPWNNWNSERASIADSVVDLDTRKDPPFAAKVGAERLESTIEGASSAYYPRFIRSHINEAFTEVTDVSELLRFVMGDTTINLQSTNPAPNGPPSFSTPNDFWISDTVLRGAGVGLDYTIPDAIAFSEANYQAFLSEMKSKLVQCTLTGAERAQCDGPVDFEVAGSTHFAAFMPVPANDDVLMASLLTRANVDNRLLKLVSPKFVAAILMVDFQNPLFSAKRKSLSIYAEAVGTATITGNSSDLATQVAAKVIEAAAKQPACTDPTLDACTAEQQFAAVWNDNAWMTTCGTRIDAYFAAVAGRMACPNGPPCDGQNDYLRLLASRHYQMAATPPLGNLVEFSLLFPFSAVATQPFLRMTATGQVVPFTAP
jgi:hypothetical protein